MFTSIRSTENINALTIELLFLPPHSLNLNLIERVWKLTKKKCLTNKYHKDFEGFRAAINQCLYGFEEHLKPELKTQLALNFQFFPNHKSSCARVCLTAPRAEYKEIPHRGKCRSCL